MRSMRYFCANWKMNKTEDEAQQFVKNLSYLLNDLNYEKPEDLTAVREIIIFPNYCSLGSLDRFIKTNKLFFKLGAQNFYPASAGAYTGETSIDILKSVGAQYFLIGHSERRHILGETQELIDRKIEFAIKHNTNIIYCFGENIEDRKNGKCAEVFEKQLKFISSVITHNPKLQKSILFAYEPVWAIGTGIRAQTNDIIEAIELVKRITNGKIIRFIYGGSVTDENVKELSTMECLMGYLVGSASLDEKKFAQIIRNG